MDRGAWRDTVHWMAKESDKTYQLKQQNTIRDKDNTLKLEWTHYLEKSLKFHSISLPQMNDASFTSLFDLKCIIMQKYEVINKCSATTG